MPLLWICCPYRLLGRASNGASREDEDMTAGINTMKLLDPQRCWTEWIRLGSLNRVRELFHDEGLRHPRTKVVPTISAIEKAAYRWALTNLDEARQDLEFA